MKIVAVVPIKLNSNRLPNKNIKTFTNGQPLCNYILNTLTEIEMIDQVYVYCSSYEIKKYMPDSVSFLKRAEHLDQDTTKINEVLTAFAKEIEADIYVMAHTTAPFVKKESIEKGLTAVIEKGYDSAFSVKKLQDFLWKGNKPFNYDLENIPRTQDLELVYIETSGFYIYKNIIISDHNRRVGDNPFMVEVSEIEGIDIDEEEDFIIADAVFDYLNYLAKRNVK